MRAWNKLNAKTVAAMKTPGRYGDGLGLVLQVTAAEGGVTKSWLFRFMRDGRARQMGLGPVHTVPLARARERAQTAREQLLDGNDPIEAKRARRLATRAEAAKAWTFKQCAEKFIAAHKAGWRNGKHADQVSATLESYAFPHFGHLDVSAIDTALVLKAIEPIWTTRTETAARVRGRIENILDYAAAHKRRSGENPARWKGNLDKLLPAKSKVSPVKHFKALPYSEIGAFVGDLRQRDAIAARALEFVILTACRTGEALGARRDEFDLDAKLWTVPAERTKSGRQHRVPLSERAVEIIKKLPKEDGSEFVFMGSAEGKPPSQMVLLMLLRRMGRTDLTVHGFRSTFRDWAAEQTAYPNEMVEMALAHVVSDKTEAAYRRGDLFDKRRRLMADWAGYCAKPPAPAKKARNVTPIRGRA